MSILDSRVFSLFSFMFCFVGDVQVDLLSCSHCFHAQCIRSFEMFSRTPHNLLPSPMPGPDGETHAQRCPVCRALYLRVPLHPAISEPSPSPQLAAELKQMRPKGKVRRKVASSSSSSSSSSSRSTSECHSGGHSSRNLLPSVHHRRQVPPK